MKTRNNLFRPFSAAAFVAVVFAMSSSAQAQALNWLGGNATNGSWNATGNFSATLGAGGNTFDLTFDNTTRSTANETGGSRTVRSITFGDSIDGTWTTNMTSSSVLTFAADSGNASLDVTSGSDANITFNGGTGFTGSQSLTSQLEIDHNGSGLLTFNRQTAGIGGITKTGTGTFVMTGFNANGFTGPLNVNGGRLVLNNTQGATQDLNAAVAINLGGGTLEARTTGAFGKTFSQNITVSSASSLAYNNTTATGRQLLLNTGTMALNAALTAQNISTTTTVDSVFNISRNLTGTGDLIVETYNNVTSGTANFALGRVAFGGANAGWSGNLILRQGTAEVFGDSSFGQVNVGTGDIIFGETANAFGAGFLVGAGTSGGKTIANDMIVRSGGFRTLRGASDNSFTFSGNVALEGDLNVHNGLFFTDKIMVLTGNITGVGGLSLTESGNPSFIRLSGINTYSGATTIGTGVNLNINSAMGAAIGDNSAVTFAGAGSFLQFNAANETVGSIASAGTDGGINLGAQTLTTGGLNTSTSFGGNISGTGGGLTKVGSGILTLTGNSTYTGALTLSGTGGLKIISDGGVRTYSPSITGSGAITVETTNNIAAAGNDFFRAAVQFSGNNSSWNGGLTVARGTVSLAGTAVNSAGAGTITLGTTADSFGAGLTFLPGAANTTYAAPITVTAGGFRAIKGSVTTDRRVALSGTIALNADANLTVDHSWSTADNRITLSGAITGPGGLTITRTGGVTSTTAVLSGVSDYAGPTSVESGASLAITGTATLISNITVQSGARIGSGGGTTGSLTLVDGANFFFFASGTTPATFNPMDVGGTVTLSNNFSMANIVGGSQGEEVDWDLTPDGTYTLIGSTPSSLSNIQNFGAANYATIPVSPTVDIQRYAYFQGTTGLQIVVSSTPPVVANPYTDWSNGAAFNVDTNGDGIENGLAFLLGAADVNVNANSFLPAPTQSGGALTLTFKMRNAAARGTASLQVQHSSDLGISDLWSTLVTVPDVDGTDSGIVFDITAGSPLNDVTATIPAAGNAAGGKLFGRLKSNE